MKRIIFLVVVGLFLLFQFSCDDPNKAGQRIKALKAAGQDHFVLTGKSIKEDSRNLTFANGSGYVFVCTNYLLDINNLKPGIDGTGDKFILQFRGPEQNVFCSSEKSLADGRDIFNEYEMPYYDFVPEPK